MFLLNSFLVVALIFYLNGVILLLGSLFEEQAAKFIDIARFYGFRDGPNPHLQRTAGMASFSLTALNMYSWYLEMPTLIKVTAILDALVVAHYTIETFYFQDLRLELYIVMAFFFLVNLGWALKEYTQRIKRENLEGVSREERIRQDRTKKLEEREYEYQTKREKTKLETAIGEHESRTIVQN